MKALLDTHAFLWWNTDDPQLSAIARAFMIDRRNEIYLSVASAWEIAIKTAKGRLVLPDPPDIYVQQRLERHRFLALPIQMSHALHVYTLPALHTDLFDRLLVAQSLLEGMPLITGDAQVARYGGKVIW